MINFKSLQNQLESNFTNTYDKVNEAALTAAESGSIEDMRAFATASQSMSTATAVLGEGMRAHHGMTKAIIDGIQ